MPKKKRNLWALLTESYHFYNKHSAYLLTITAVAFIPLIILDRWFYMRVDLRDVPAVLAMNTSIPFRGQLLSIEQFVLLMLGTIAMTTVLLILYQITLLQGICKIDKKEKLNVLATYQEAWRNGWPYCIIVLKVMWWVSLGTVFFIVPGIIVFVLYSLSVFAFFVDGKKGGEALSYSRQIVQKNIKKYLGNVSAMLAMIFCVCTLIIYILEMSFEAYWSCYYTLSSFVGELLQDVWIAIIGIYFVIFFYFLYKELRIQN